MAVKKSLLFAIGLLILFNSCTDAARIARGVARIAGKNDAVRADEFENIKGLQDRLERASRPNSYKINYTKAQAPYIELSFINLSDMPYTGLLLTMNYRVAEVEKKANLEVFQLIKPHHRITEKIEFTSEDIRAALTNDKLEIHKLVIKSIFLADSTTTDTSIVLRRSSY